MEILKQEELAVAYLRVSTKEQELEGYSLDNQERQTIKYAEEKNLKIIKFWKCSESAWGKKERKAFNEMINFVRKRKDVRHIIFYSPDRMTRNIKDNETIKELREEHGKVIHFSQFGEKEEGRLTSSNEMMSDIRTSFNKFFSNFISEKTAPAMEEKAKTGVYPGCAPIGYLNNKIDKTIEVDNDRAHYIQSLFEKIASGNYSMRVITKELAEQGLTSKKTGGKVSKSTLYNTVNNPFYYGEFYWNGELHKGTHKPLVSKELWKKANEILRSDKPYITGKKFAFNGIVRCGVCGCTVSGGKYKKNKYTYYHCSQSKEQHKSPFISEQEMSERLRKIVSDVIIPNNISDWLKTGMEIYSERKEKSNKNIRETLSLELEKSKKILERTYQRELEDDNLSDSKKEFYRKTELELEEKIKNLKKELQKIGKNAKQIMREVDDTIQIMKNLSKWYEKGDYFDKGEIVKALTNKVILTKDNELIPTYRQPFNLFASAKKQFENSNKLPNVKAVVEKNLSKNKKDNKQNDLLSQGLDFSEWGG